jgi:hypothetical protein
MGPMMNLFLLFAVHVVLFEPKIKITFVTASQTNVWRTRDRFHNVNVPINSNSFPTSNFTVFLENVAHLTNVLNLEPLFLELQTLSL